MIYLILFIGYLVGSINSAHFISKLKNIDIREVGSKNPGASNITIKMGWRYGILTGILDISKAFVPVFTLKLLGFTDLELLMMGIAVIIGHIYPIIHKFRGGKGTACFVGLAFALNPLYGFILGLTIVFATIITDYITYGTLLMMLFFIIGNIYLYDTTFVLVSLIIPALSVYKHWENIGRIRRGEETGLRETFK